MDEPSLLRNDNIKINEKVPNLRKVSKPISKTVLPNLLGESTQEYTFEPADGGWSWLVLLGCIIIHMMMPILPSMFGLLFIHLVEELKLSSLMIAWFFNTQMFLWSMSCLMAGPICIEFGYRPVAFLGGFLAAAAVFFTSFSTSPVYIFFVFFLPIGLGGGLSFSVCHMVLPYYFKNKRSFAFAIMMAGASLGQFSMPLLIRYLQIEYGFSKAPVILSAIVLHTCVAALIFHPPKWHSIKVPQKSLDVSLLTKTSSDTYIATENEEVKTIDENLDSNPKTRFSFYRKIRKIVRHIGHQSYENLTQIKNPKVAIIALSSGCFVSAFVNFLLMLPFSIIDKGFTIQTTAYCISASAIANLAGRLSILPFAAFFKRKYSVCFYAVFGQILMFLGLFAFTFLRNLAAIIIALSCFALGIGISMGLFTLVMIDIAGLERLSSTFGVSSISIGFFSLVIGPLSGWLRDSSQSYDVSNRSLAGVIFLGLFLWCWMPYSIKKQRESETVNEVSL